MSGTEDQGTGDWLTEGHRLAKRATNSVVNRWGDGPDTPAGVRARLSDGGGPADALLERMSDDTILAAITGVRLLYRRWDETPPGGLLRLDWPLPAAFFTGATGEGGPL